ncbi:MAG: SIMPL domain-containing protein [Patescibacteria group bacterium]|nr:SIMPL domain-containing protein [Patescibacteria group bacterium]
MLNIKNLDIKKSLVIIIAIIIFGAIMITAIIQDRFIYQNQYQISVIGQGKVQYKNDTAKINLGVQIDNIAKAEDALNQLNTKINKIYSEVEKLGINREDIKTQNYYLNPNYNVINNNPKVTGYNANQTIVVTLKDIEKNEELISKIIQTATINGANQINGVSFENSKINDIKQEARIKAIEDARGRSRILAKALGVKLGKVVGWWETYNPEMSYGGSDKGGMGAGGISPTITAGIGEITVEVNISYKIK